MLKKELEARIIELETEIIKLEDELVFQKKENRNLTIKLDKAIVQKKVDRPKYNQHHYSGNRK